jgi:enoyl-CoA hydratase/methylglutaconyl-CoA hydratase
LVSYAAANGVATLTLDSPHNRNALSRQLVEELLTGLAQADADPSVSAVLVTSSGPAFCSGADLTEASAGGMAETAARIVALQRLIVGMDKPVVTRVSGAVRAGGIGIVAASDISIANEAATFALTEVRLGLAAAVISLTVHHRMNPRAASLTTLGGEVFNGAEAAAYGLVTKAVGAERLDDAVADVCGSLLLGSAQGLRESKRLLNRDLLLRLDRYGGDLAELSAQLFASPDAQAAMARFLADRRGS